MVRLAAYTGATTFVNYQVDRSNDAMSAVTSVLNGGAVLKGDQGEADKVAVQELEQPAQLSVG